MEFAEDAARQLNHEYIGAEHLLLGLLNDREISRLLTKLGTDANTVRDDLQAVMVRGDSPAKLRRLPLVPRVKRIFEEAVVEAKPFDRNGRLADAYDLLVGILVDNGSAAALILVKHQLTAEAVRLESGKLRNSQD